MLGQSETSNELVREALAIAVSDYGARALSNSQLLRNILNDYLPDAPRLVDALTIAAEANLADRLTAYLNRNVDIATAIRLTTASLRDRRALDPAAITWAVTEFARALGQPVADLPAPLFSGFSGGTSFSSSGRQAVGGYGNLGFRSSAVKQPTIGVGGVLGTFGRYQSPSYAPQAPVQPPVLNDLPPTVSGLGQPSGDEQPPWGPPPVGTTTAKKRNPAVFAVCGFLALILSYFAVAAAAKLPPFPKSTATTSARGLRPLEQFLPADTSNCQPQSSLLTGLSTATTNVGCDDADLAPIGNTTTGIFGYQFGTNGAYEAALLALNNDEGFNVASAESRCPPSPATSAGQSTWNDSNGDTGIEECFTATLANSDGSDGGSYPIYIWTIPSENIILEAIGPPSGSITAVGTWWRQNALG